MSDDGNDLHGIAIIGMAGRFPRAKNVSELWRNVRDGIDCVSYFQDDELDPAPPSELLRDPSYVKARGVLEDADLFDAGFFGIPPRQAELMDPQNRLFLETSWHALEDAGYDPGRVNGTVGLFGGVTFSSYFLNNLLSNPDLLAAVGGYQVALGTDRDYLTTLVSYKLDLKGPSINVQTACSTSLVAVVLACQSLLAYGCDMALAGGVSVKVPQKTGYLYKPGGLDSAQGRCRAFDAAADGSVYGGGVGVVVLKRLEDALADGDAIYGVILGSAVNNDGAARVGFTAPGVEGQAEAIAQAQALAGVDPATIGYVECHGTGTALGDPIEVAALSKAFRAGAQGDLPRGFCALGSIKTNIGHCSAAAGVAGLIKATLALAHRQIPPTLHFENPNPAIGFETTPFRVSTHLADWETDGAPRRAGVSSFGLGGTNAHVVLEEAPEPEPSGPSRPWQLLLLSARSETALEAATDNLAQDLGAHPDRPLADVAFTLQVGRRAFAHRRMLVCRDTEDAREALARRDPRRLLSDVREGGNRPVAFLFPGVGDHYAGMARRLYETEPTFREELDRCCDLLAPRLGRDLRPLILAERASGSAGPDLRRLLGRGEAEPSERPLDRTLYAQPAVFAVEYALARLLFEWGLRPEAMLGYSLGEYVAACLAGVLSLEDALALVAERARLIDGLAPGAMLAVPLPEERVRSLVAGSGLDLAAVNGPAVCVVAGPVGAIEALKERLAGEGVPTRRLPTTHAFHSHRMEPVAPALSRLARGLRLQAPKIPYVSNVTGTWITAREATDPEYWARHLCQPVRFGEGLAALWQNPDRVLLEVGPGFGLSTLALQLPAQEGTERTALPCLPNEHDPQPDDAFLLGTLGKLWLSGVEIDWVGFHTHEQRRRVRLPLYPFERVRYWVEPRRQAAPESQPSLPSLQSLQSLSPRPRLKNAWVPPETATEKAIAGLFGELLGIEGVGLHDSFFELGGHSLLGTSLLSRLRALYGVELPLRILFEEPTVAGLAAHVAEGADVSAAPPLVPVPRDRDLPLSFAQQRLWFLDRLMPGNPFYNLSGGVRLTGPLDVPALRRSLQTVVQRHETLRTGFAEVEGTPVQRIVPDLTLEIPVLDLADLPAEVRRIARDQARTPFDLTRPGLLRVALLRLGDNEHVLLWAIHHIVSDAWSNAVLMGEVAALYAGKPLPEMPVQYADFTVWQRDWLSGETLERQLAYWRERLAGAPAVELPTDRARPPVQTFRGATYRVTYGRPLLDGLTALARQRDASFFMALLAAFDALLCRFTGQEDVVVGSPIANRTRPELEGLIGFFVNTLVLRTDASGDPAFPALLDRARETALGAFAHQDLPFEQLVEELQPRRDLSRNPLFQVMLNLLNAPPARVEVSGDLEMSTLPAGEGAALFDLQAYVTESPEGLRIAWEHNTDLFDRGTIERLSRSFETLLSGIVARPEIPLWDLPLLTENERSELLLRWNDTAAPVPEPGTIHALFEAQAERRPDAVALVFEGETLTYAELNARANRAAHHLRALGVGPEVLVALRLERSVPAVVAVLAVLKAGGAYLPLDPAHPADRLAFLVEDSGAALVLTGLEETENGANPEPLAGPGNLAYVLYTSGSTGRPKGVSVTHGSVVNFLASVARWPGLGPEDAVLAVTTLSFDIAGYELLLPLTVGARIVLVTRETALDGKRLAAVLAEEKVTRMQVTPATWRLLLGSGWSGEPDLMALSGGEALPRDLARELLPRAGSLWNFYGPTEATIWSSVWKVTDSEGPIPIGLPVANTEIHLLDRRLEPVPLGVSGELYIGGAGLARGYLHRPDLTAERFIPDPFSSGQRLYRTGDLARRLPGGEIDFLGRADHQVKIRGFRVEPGEIEAVLAEDPAVRQAVVVLREDTPGDPRLVAYVVRDEPGDGARLREILAARLPAYMIPSAFVDLEALPLTPSGKVDRRALPAPGTERGDRAWAEPETETERTLAGIWSALLRLDRVGREDDFFELGGHSLLATQLVARVRDAFGVELPLPAVFRETTLAALAARVDREAVEAAPPLPRLERHGRTVAPLSYTQRGLWFLDRMEPGSPTYILASALRLTGRLDVAAFARSFEEVVDRHEALRATFTEQDGEPVQILAPALALSIPRVDLRALPEAARESETRRLGRQEARRPFDLAAGPLLRVTLLRLGDEEHVALFALHHIAADAWSVGVLVGEVAALYAAFVRGLPSPLPPLPLQYPDWVEWQRELLEGPARDVQLAWWTERLAGAPPLDLPADRPRPAVQTTRVAALQTSASADLGARGGVTPFMVLLAVFETLLSRIAGQDDFVVGIPIANRRSSELEKLIGLFINTLALRAGVAGSPTFAELLARVRETTVEAYAHQDLPLEVILRALGLERDLSRAPLFQILFQVQNAPAAAAFELPELTLAPVELGVAQAADYDLVVTYLETPRGLSGTWVYNTDLFDRPTAARLARSFHTLLAAAVADPSRSLASLPLLPESERWQVLGEWNGTPAPGLPDGAGELRRLFEIQAARVPEALALAWEKGSLSYGDLNRRANRLAHGLRKLGVGPEVLVGLLVERSPAMIVGMLGVLKAGGAYLPLDPSYPAERLDLMLGDAGAALVLTEARIDDPAWTAGESEENPEEGTGPDFPAYVIYTSGSTGTPKGVVALNRGLASFTRAMAGVLKLGPGDRFLEFPSFSFDASLVSIAATLASGAALVLHRDPTGLSIDELLAFCAAQRVTHLDIPVAFLRQIVQELATRGERGFGGAPVRALLTGGESLSREALLQWAGLVGRDESLFLSSYGPTETTVTASVFTITACEAAGLTRGTVPLGRPLPGVAVLVLDDELSPVPVGVPGEVWIGGAGVTRGYLRRPGLTADAFRPDPLGRAGERIYRTGDRARWLPSGHLEFLGRADHQVKVRGFRIELGEVEAALARHPAVEHAVVVAMGDGGERRLVAYAVPAGNAPEGLVRDLRAFLRESLPEAMIPSAVVLLDKLPVTPGGKIDRRALPRPDLSEAPDRDHAPPRGEIAETLAVVWARLLGVDRVGAADDFFDLGGHSLLATQLVSRIREVFGVELPLRRLFETPTLQALAAAVEAAGSVERGMAAPPVVPVPRDGDLPLSFAQERLWFLDQLQPGQPTYNMPSAVRMSGPLAPAALERAFARVVGRHEILRTTFPAVAGRPVQRIAPPAPFPLPVVDLGTLPAGEREREAARLTALEAARPFDLANGPLLRAGLLRLGEGEHLLLATLHHIVADGWSMGILIRELGAAYQALDLPGLPVQYADWAVWQRQWLEGDVLETQLSFWRRQLGGDVAVLELPADRPRPAVATFRGDRRSTVLPAVLAGSLEALARREEATLFMTLLAAFDVLLSRLTGQTDVPVGTPVAGRSRGEVEGLIGLFLNTLVLREDLSGDPAFRDLLARLRGTALDAFAHQDLPFERLVEDLQPRRTLNQTPLFQVMLVLQNAPGGALGAGDLTLAPVVTAAPAARFDLTLVLWTAADGLHAAAEYRSDLFEGSTVERWLGHFRTLLEGVVADPGRRISDLPLLTPAERDQIVSAWNDTAQDLGPPACLHDLFYEQAARTPDAPAILWKNGQTTYGDLARQADRLARRLREKGVGPGALVALLLDPSPERVAAVLAVLRAGAAYVPLDPAYPADRLDFMMEDTGAALLLTRETLAAALEEPDVEDATLPAAAPDDRAYVIYTSGSTGRPKGVVIRHSAAVNTVRDVNRRFGAGSGDRVFAVSALSFDLSVYDLFGPLAVGGAVVLPEPSATPDPAAWSAALTRHGVTIWDSAPALMDLLVSSGAPLPKTLRLVLLSGDWIPVTLPGEIRRRVPGARVISLGGATEASIWSILYPIPDVPPAWTSIPYGRPMANQAFHVLDPAGHPAPVGVAGELHIGGIGVADGYHARPDLTAEKFVPDPFTDRPGARLYRTGDLGRRFPDGTIEFLGRRDHQVKIRGFRIELGEIEAVLNAHPAVRESVVLARQEEGLAKSAGLSQARLVAYVVPEPGADLAALRAHLAARLPEHMVPSVLVPLESIPLTPNGKVDRRALPAPEAGPDREAEFVPPRDGVEETIAALWKDLLKVDRVGAHDNFFALGGHSLLATRVAAALRDAFGVEIPLHTLFEKPTVAGLALAVAQLRLEQADTTEATRLLETLEGLSDEEVEALLAGEEGECEEV